MKKIFMAFEVLGMCRTLSQAFAEYKESVCLWEEARMQAEVDKALGMAAVGVAEDRAHYKLRALEGVIRTIIKKIKT